MKRGFAHWFRVLGVSVVIMSAPLSASAWDGYDWDSGSFVEIERGNKVRRGLDIEFFDYSAGEYRSGEVVDISRFGRTVEVEVIDHDTGEHRVFQMED